MSQIAGEKRLEQAQALVQAAVNNEHELTDVTATDSVFDHMKVDGTVVPLFGALGLSQRTIAGETREMNAFVKVNGFLGSKFDSDIPVKISRHNALTAWDETQARRSQQAWQSLETSNVVVTGTNSGGRFRLDNGQPSGSVPTQEVDGFEGLLEIDEVLDALGPYVTAEAARESAEYDEVLQLAAALALAKTEQDRFEVMARLLKLCTAVASDGQVQLTPFNLLLWPYALLDVGALADASRYGLACAGCVAIYVILAAWDLKTLNRERLIELLQTLLPFVGGSLQAVLDAYHKRDPDKQPDVLDILALELSQTLLQEVKAKLEHEHSSLALTVMLILLRDAGRAASRIRTSRPDLDGLDVSDRSSRERFIPDIIQTAQQLVAIERLFASVNGLGKYLRDIRIEWESYLKLLAFASFHQHKQGQGDEAVENSDAFGPLAEEIANLDPVQSTEVHRLLQNSPSWLYAKDRALLSENKNWDQLSTDLLVELNNEDAQAHFAVLTVARKLSAESAPAALAVVREEVKATNEEASDEDTGEGDAEDEGKGEGEEEQEQEEEEQEEVSAESESANTEQETAPEPDTDSESVFGDAVDSLLARFAAV